ncbi:MAG: hypothetical protein ACOVOJ_17485, partial [Pirellula sp.]
MKKLFALPALMGLVTALSAGAAQAAFGGAISYENCGCNVVDPCGPSTHTVMKTVRKVVYEPETVTGTKVVNQIVYEDQQVQRVRYERETQHREVSYTVNVPVRETHTGVRNYT